MYGQMNFRLSAQTRYMYLSELEVGEEGFAV